ncbi:helix-turn-helix transcriptional regulator [Chloroflexota bacterium]
MRRWTLLTNHGLVLSLLSRESRIIGRDIANKIGITETAVRRIVADLDAGGYIDKKKEGRRLHYSVKPDSPLRHNEHCRVVINDLLNAVKWLKDK